MNKHKTLWHLSLVVATLALCLMSPSSIARATDVPWNTTHIIDGSFDGALSVTTADIDGDGDLDVLGAASDANDVAWWENDGSGGGWTYHAVDTNFTGAQEAHAADMDNDGDLDILGVGSTIISYWENDGVGGGWTERVVIGSFNNARSVYPADVDGDGDTDVLGANVANGVVWWENDRTLPDDGTPWTQRNVPTFDYARVVSAADIDSDGDLDVLAGSDYYDQVRVYRNNGSGTAWTAHTLSGFTDPYSLQAADLDGDGDLDVVGAGTWGGTAGWWENTDGAGTGWTYRQLTGAPDRAVAIYPADMDNDGDIDVLGTFDYSAYPNVIWWENDGSPTDGWVQRWVWSGFTGAAGICASDLDGDGDLDVIATSNSADDVAWWENETIHRNATFPLIGEHTVDGAFSGAWSVDAADVDGDGDTDVLGAAYSADDINWWENTDGAGTTWTEHTVDGAFGGAVSVDAADVDGDGDTDVLGAARNAADITWWENTDGIGTAWIEHTVDGAFGGASSVHAADVDGDGDTDVLGAARNAADITWWENTDGIGTAWTEHTVDGDFDYASSVDAADVDGDGDIDVLGAAELDHDITWWENTNGAGTAWTQHIVDGVFVGAWSVYGADVDGDGDIDVLGASHIGYEITWWENTNGVGTAWTEHTVDGSFVTASSVYAADVDGDGDTDVLGTASEVSSPLSPDDITWWENANGLGTAWAEHTIDGAFDGATSVYAADVDGDGDLDVLGTAANAYDITWWENRGGQFGLDTADTAPGIINSGGMDDLLRITARHNGRAGDGDIELASLELLFEESAGDPLTSAEANALVASLHVFRDDGSGVFESGSDTLVTSVDTLALTDGVQTVTFADGDPNVQVVLGAPRTFFVVVEPTADAGGQTPFQLRLTHLTESSSTAQDRDHDIPLSLEYAPDISSSIVDLTADIIYLAPDVPTCTGFHPCVTISWRVLNRLNDNGTLVILAANDIPETLAGTGRDVTVVGGSGDVLDWDGGEGALVTVPAGTVTVSGTLTLSCTTNCAGSTAFLQSGGTLSATHLTISGFDNGFSQTGGTLTAHSNTLSGIGTGTAFASYGTTTVYSNTVTGFENGFNQMGGTLTAYGNTISGGGTGTAFASSGTSTLYGNTIAGFSNMFIQSGGTLTAYNHTLSGSGTAFQLVGTATVYSTTLTGFANGFDHSGGSLDVYSNTLSGNGTGTAVASNGTVTAHDNTATGFASGFDHSGDTLLVYNNMLSGSGGGTAFASSGAATVHDNTAIGFAVAFDHSGSTLLAHGNIISGTGTAFLVSGNTTAYGNTASGFDTVFDLSGATLTAYANNLEGFDTALAWSGGSWNLNHNWWGVAFAPSSPTGLDPQSWSTRLGAPVESWASGDGSATLDGAELGGGTGTAVIVSHGREPANAPFGVEIAPAAEMCSDYYDFFTVGGSGLWMVKVPVDDDPACDTVFAESELFWALDVTQCTPGSTTCYDLVPSVSQETGPPRQLVLASVPTNFLYGTLFATGARDLHTTVYLPLVVRSRAPSPDLVVERITATPDNATVVIKNQTAAPAVNTWHMRYRRVTLAQADDMTPRYKSYLLHCWEVYSQQT